MTQPTLTTAVPAAIDALLDLAESAVPEGVRVFDGAVRAGQGVDEYVLISGWDSESQQPATFGGPRSFSIEEEFGITGTIWCYEGSENQRASRQAAFAIYSALQTALRSPQGNTLGGTVRVAWIERQSGQLGVPEKTRGNGTEIAFTVHCESRIN